MFTFDADKSVLAGPRGSLAVPEDDEVTRKLAMLIDGQPSKKYMSFIERH